MRVSFCILPLLALGAGLSGQVAPARVAAQISQGEAGEVRKTLKQAAERSPRDPAALLAYAEFLDRFHDPEARQAYQSALAAARDTSNGAAPGVLPILRRLVVLDLLAGDRQSASRHLAEYTAAGGTGLSGLREIPAPASPDTAFVTIPGPINSFARMAALAPDMRSADILPALARNVVTSGYQASMATESLEQTEYLKLVIRYLTQARELEHLAGPQRVLRIEQCDSPQTGEVLRVLGYRMRGACGGDVVLETVNATRAFLTIDSGFPLAEFEQALRTNRPFVYDYQPSRVPVKYDEKYWLSAQRRQEANFIDAFLGDPGLCRMYLGLSKLDRQTADALQKGVDPKRLRTFAHVLDFYGSMYEIRDGKATVPGSQKTAAAWAELVGVSPERGVEFFDTLVAKDDGWMASFFDAVSRTEEGPLREYLTEPERMKRFYFAIRGRVTVPGPARPVFRANADMMLLTTRLRVDSSGRAVLPGNLEVWKNLFIQFPKKRIDKKLQDAAPGWRDADDVIEALFALTRKSVENEPLKIYMTVTEIDRHRATPLTPATVERLARDYRDYGDQYSLFADVPSLTDASIMAYLDAARHISSIDNNELRANMAGSFQGLTGLWQLLCRNGSIPEAQADTSFSSIVKDFSNVRAMLELFENTRAGIYTLLKATGSPPASGVQERMFELLAGLPTAADQDARSRVIQELSRGFEAQRLISLDDILGLARNLEAVAKGEQKPDTALINRVSTRIAELQSPRLALSSAERTTASFGYWAERHISTERKLRLRAEIEKAGLDAGRVREIIARLPTLLRNTIVGLNYLAYVPPGAQIIYTNPLFVRSHDFIGSQGSNQTWASTQLFGTGWPTNAGGRLVGSLAGLPYALAEAEQNFLIPSREQALIWADLVPQMLISAKVPRWWRVEPQQMHWVGLHIRHGESLLAEAAVNVALRQDVLQTLRHQITPARLALVAGALAAGDVPAARDEVTPAELFLLAKELVQKRGDDSGGHGAEIRRMMQQSPAEINYDAISRAFGTPKPTLTKSYRSQLLHLRTFPTLMCYSSRLLAESWESNLLYYAALADEIHQPPSQLNLLIPEWTQKTVERIFATNLEDWPALLRSLRQVGDEVRSNFRKGAEAPQQASMQ